MRASVLFACFAALCLAIPAHAADPEKFASALDQPVDIAFGPDGRLYVAELASGRIMQVMPDGSAREVARVPASAGGNGGFTGLVVDPLAPDVLYVHYSMLKDGAPNGKVNRISRVADGNEVVLLDDMGWAEMHVGGRIAFGPDGFLYATTGDNDHRTPSQDPQSLLGKILRFDRNGTAAPGNPSGWNPFVWARGFRNPFGIDITADGGVFVSDNGGKEEVNLVKRGGNYGYPMCTGPCNASGTEDPVAHWGPIHFGPTGLAVVGETVYLGDFVFGQIRTVNLATRETGVLLKADGGVLDVAHGPDGCLYYATWTGVYRVPLNASACALPDVAPPPPDDDGSVLPPGPASIPAAPAALGALAALGAALARRRANRPDA